MEYFHKCGKVVECCIDPDFGDRYYACRKCNVQIQDIDAPTELFRMQKMGYICTYCGVLHGIDVNTLVCKFCNRTLELKDIAVLQGFVPVGP